MFKIDLHTHTEYSIDCKIDVRILMKQAIKIGLNAVAITDHDTNKGIKKAYENNDLNIIIIPGIEFTIEEGHLIGLFIEELPKKRLRLEELIDFIHREGGIAVAAHPLDIFRRFTNLEENINILDGIEVANSSDLNIYKNMEKLMKICEEKERIFTAGSDAHVLEALGNTYMYTEENIEDIDILYSKIVNKELEISAKRTSILSRIKKYL
jgi:hypothetical protein